MASFTICFGIFWIEPPEFLVVSDGMVVVTFDDVGTCACVVGWHVVRVLADPCGAFGNDLFGGPVLQVRADVETEEKRLRVEPKLELQRLKIPHRDRCELP